MDLELIRPRLVGEMQRVGSKHDGGYVVPKHLPPVSTLVSFGLGDDWAFEKDLLNRGCIHEFCFFDHTVSISGLLNRAWSRITTRNFSLSALSFRLIILTRYMIDFKLKRFKHIPKKVTARESDSRNTNLFEVAESILTKEFILKIDIEGSEYLLIDQICSIANRVPLLIIEFHDTESNRELFEKSMGKLLEIYVNCHVHANNYESRAQDGLPLALEFTFGRKDLYGGQPFVGSLPIHGLDSPSSASRIDHVMLFS